MSAQLYRFLFSYPIHVYLSIVDLYLRIGACDCCNSRVGCVKLCGAFTFSLVFTTGEGDVPAKLRAGVTGWVFGGEYVRGA